MLPSIRDFDYPAQATLYYQSIGVRPPADLEEIDENSVDLWVSARIAEEEGYPEERLSEWVSAELATYPDIYFAPPARRAS